MGKLLYKDVEVNVKNLSDVWLCTYPSESSHETETTAETTSFPV